jgi:hypothetical protein
MLSILFWKKVSSAMVEAWLGRRSGVMRVRETGCWTSALKRLRWSLFAELNSIKLVERW